MPREVYFYYPGRKDCMVRTFRHTGDMGDIVYALPTVRALGGGVLYLNTESPPLPGGKRLKFTGERARFLKPLLLEQHYIRDVRICEIEDPDFNLDLIRHYIGLTGIRRKIDWLKEEMNLADVSLMIFGLGKSERDRQWLNVAPRSVARYVFHRSNRAHVRLFPWSRFVEAFGQEAVFIGFESEWAEFQEAFGSVEFLRVSDALEMAAVIAGSHFFIGNQSLPSAIAEGLKHNAVLEAMPYLPNGQFSRANIYNPLFWDPLMTEEIIEGIRKWTPEHRSVKRPTEQRHEQH